MQKYTPGKDVGSMLDRDGSPKLNTEANVLQTEGIKLCTRH